MARQLGIGVIGMGWMGQVHSRSYRQAAERFWDEGIQPRLVVCADEVEERRLEAQARFGFARTVADWRAVVEDPEVDVVNIAAPNHLHLPMATAAARAGKHIFCEKPVGRFPAETGRIEEAARRAGVLSFVGFNYRWAPVVQYARQLIEAGRLGDLTHYRGRFLVGYANKPDGVLSWRFDGQKAGLGALGDLMSHVIDMAHMMAGPIVEAVGNGHTFIAARPLPTPGAGTHFSVGGDGPKGPVTNEDYVGALVRFANGAQGVLEACRVINGAKSQMAFDVYGTKGSLSWNFERMNELQLYLPDQGEPAREGHARLLTAPEHPLHARFQPGPALGLGYDDLKTIEAYRFLQSIVRGQQGEPGFAQALAVARVQAAIARSWTHTPWERVGAIDPAD